jgi:hypothetical protein
MWPGYLIGLIFFSSAPEQISIWVAIACVFAFLSGSILLSPSDSSDETAQNISKP